MDTKKSSPEGPNPKKLEELLGKDVLGKLVKGYAHLERKNIFLCHSHKDRSFVRRLARDLDEFHILASWDKYLLEPGDSLHQCIGQAIEKSTYVGVVLSPNSVDSNWCRSELEQALTREKRTGKKVAIPLLYRRVRIPPFLEGRLYLNFSKRYYIALARLIAFLMEIPTKHVMQKIDDSPPKSIADIKRLIYSLADHSPALTIIEPDKYGEIREMFQKVNVPIPIDSFRIQTKDRACICCDLAIPLKIEGQPIIYLLEGQAKDEKKNWKNKKDKPK